VNREDDLCYLSGVLLHLTPTEQPAKLLTHSSKAAPLKDNTRCSELVRC
jgi:hypothetical protein